MSIFGDLDLRLEGWAEDYGSGAPLDQDGEDADDAAVDAGVEFPAEQWRALAPRPGGAAFERVAFVDGVRRVDRRVRWRAARADQDAPGHALFGSFAVGCVVAGDGRAEWGPARVERRLALGSGRSLPRDVEVARGLVYAAVSTPKSDADAPLVRLQGEMRDAEQRLARELADADGTLVVCDGPLTFGDRVKGAALGLAKRLTKLYVSGAPARLVARLRAGERTPLFVLTRPRGFARYSWFLRLADPAPLEMDLAGLVRLEVSTVVGLETARRLADESALRLPRFASTRARDPRAPQNLLPVGALERRLRHLLGDSMTIGRRVEALIAREARRD